MDISHNVWLHMVNQIESFAKVKDFDINGLKLRLSVYWHEDGTIKHLVYYPRLKSKNIDYSLLTSLLTEFVANYQLPIQSDSCFYQDATADFPSFAHRFIKDSKK